MDKIEQSNKVKILEELHKNGRATVSEIAKKTGLTRQTVAKTINNMEKKKEIWGYSAIFDPKLIGKKPFIFLCKVDLSKNPEEFLKKAVNDTRIKEAEEKLGFQITLFLHGSSDIMSLIWAKDIIEAKKILNNYKIMFNSIAYEIELLDVIATMRSSSISNPNMVEEWTNLLI